MGTQIEIYSLATGFYKFTFEINFKKLYFRIPSENYKATFGKFHEKCETWTF